MQLCKFQRTHPSFVGFRKFIKMQKYTEYYIAKKKGKLHFKKWRFEIQLNLFVSLELQLYIYVDAALLCLFINAQYELLLYF